MEDKILAYLNKCDRKRASTLEIKQHIYGEGNPLGARKKVQATIFKLWAARKVNLVDYNSQPFSERKQIKKAEEHYKCKFLGVDDLTLDQFFYSGNVAPNIHIPQAEIFIQIVDK